MIKIFIRLITIIVWTNMAIKYPTWESYGYGPNAFYGTLLSIILSAILLFL